MPKANIIAGMSQKRPGPVEYSSDSHHVSVELIDVEVKDATHFHAVTHALFSEVKAALEAEVTGGTLSSPGTSGVSVWGGPGGNGHNGNGHTPTRAP